jgi:hypothetical protein
MLYKHNMDFHNELIEESLKPSYGHPEMSAIDTKMILLSLKALSEYHEMLIHDLIEKLAEEPEKKFWQFWK